MAGSLDNQRTLVLSADEYEYIVLSTKIAEIWVSPRTSKSRKQIADELRRVANFVEGQ